MRDRGGRRLRPRIVQQAPEAFSDENAANRPRLDAKRAVTITRSTFVRAPAERCFEIIDRQLEETPEWDPTIVWVSPISKKHVRVGSTSRVTFSLGSATEEAIVMVRSFSPNRSILWTSNHSTQLQEEWRLEPEPHATVVTVTLGYNPAGRLLGRLMDRVAMRSKVEKAVSEMLEKLKMTVEHNQRV